MTRTVRFLSRSTDSDEKSTDIVCRAATALAFPAGRDMGPGGVPQIATSPTVIVLYEVEPESMVTLRTVRWTHIQWSEAVDASGRDFAVWRIFIEGENVRVLV